MDVKRNEVLRINLKKSLEAAWNRFFLRTVGTAPAIDQ